MADVRSLKTLIAEILNEDEASPNAQSQSDSAQKSPGVSLGEIERAINDMSYENLERKLKSGKNLVDMPHFFALSVIERLIDLQSDALKANGLLEELKRAETAYANAIKSVHDALLHVKQRK